ncbi:MAG: hypothetical protein A3B74_05455 [Candidatus Kerfeldbacteria bacterium RIFCSPHIGHO2_02_FULL_42_14]|uniref:Uncharacterized protein n=1 Tax=Candidatus Kerfeldbacteria bacterium RIFCSPHIGHO2_02_FULL_42_14 TaxID=1798540 RepID=A0A1G2AT32_9BACT|nr:MAG: hypothetical protein A3B74_05455 [Candidatus Kerfeldbacteria bacterium RIFCSPHIGHO2_02_FULL_42_14]OGY81569.1 MAG: hypothetical protein A3E60_01785 [Candidatus Kerfeldbacteria bacterium RIFCSPHIGHO2_12_FULL_42_13]OGY83169.1 MAG: hypothetical protein A3I91_03195 [Candidatus Kerfeldbacteria bacterium RIFCSPLOWO2_02_FULL_42_19]OGY86277.1 MAG: hypothetical protein A3G01_00420 [Candidatus Kerfeldbacteria bacterium RIFCSPLOWO2_12_FULL_43_9]
MRWVVGIVLIIIGVLLVIYAEPIFRFVGRNAWAEKYLGTEGGTRILIKLIGLGIILLGLLIATGWIFDILESIFRFPSAGVSI